MQQNFEEDAASELNMLLLTGSSLSEKQKIYCPVRFLEIIRNEDIRYIILPIKTSGRQKSRE